MRSQVFNLINLHVSTLGIASAKPSSISLLFALPVAKGEEELRLAILSVELIVQMQSDSILLIYRWYVQCITSLLKLCSRQANISVRGTVGKRGIPCFSRRVKSEM